MRVLLDAHDPAVAHVDDGGPAPEEVGAPALQRALVGGVELDPREAHAHHGAVGEPDRAVDDETDEEGETRRAEIDAGGPVAYRSSLAVDAIVDALREEGIPAAASRDAGGFLCNHVFYVLMRALAERPGTRGGFVHVPLLQEQALEKAVPTMPLETLVRAARVILARA